ncbi:hypothetical protein E2562_013487 [Oryza meyeriana var. granulata]|uniref:Uncharacterized protein n=1 Tax=Oryza meyeriana var. granulata TaxID=110450 RepID=A0A6G1BVG2_9ORYZ|nr:hypothetical protein E2562_013487 [Oryza meyeriana var. granulata]
MYQLRVDAVKEYFWKKHGEELDDALARSYELSEQEYLDGFIEWAGEEAWPLLCCHWSGDKFLQKRKKTQESRLKCENDARNRGGSRPYTKTQQWLEYNYGPEKATGVNTFAVMKSGAKNIDSSGSSGPMLFEKIGEEPPPDEDLMSPLHAQRTGSSHVGLQSDLASFDNRDDDANIGCEGREGNISCEGREQNIGCKDNYTSSMDRSNNGASWDVELAHQDDLNV